MDYKRIYEKLIERCLGRVNSPDTYLEKHHIIPRCLKGTDAPDNLVSLTAEEHFLAHQLLVRIYPGNVSLVYAASAMTVDRFGQRYNNKLFGWIRRRQAEAARAQMTGHIPSEETRRKRSKAMTGRKHSVETRQKMSDKAIGHEVRPETREKLAKARLGTKMSEDAKRKGAEARRGLKQSPETKAKRVETQRRNREAKRLSELQINLPLAA